MEVGFVYESDRFIITIFVQIILIEYFYKIKDYKTKSLNPDSCSLTEY